ncbi:Hypothetical protein GLP15_5040 [Giardia lamblia P15]|uniref:ATP-dependent RNA helicase n=1 Tax=Giardia intestinalis (strain P15) TaxID=658858 RepID=E1EZK4_GIAIA|nr:Hypothetical protein GLP15_5040 [Giardia lamblia P15]
MDDIWACNAVPQTFLDNLKKLGYTDLLPIQRRVLEIWFNGTIPKKADEIRRIICNSMANNMFIASATGSGKTLSAILPLALEAFAGLDFVALFVVPTTHLLTQTYHLLLNLFHNVPTVQIFRAMDCLGATLYEDPALLRLDPDVVAALEEHHEVLGGTDNNASMSIDDHLVKRFLDSLTKQLSTEFPDFRKIIEYGEDKTSYIICGTPGIVSALLTTVKPAPDARPASHGVTPFLKLRHVVMDEADHILLNDNTSFLVLIRAFFAQRSSTAVFRVPLFFAQRHRLGLPTDRFVFLSATMKYRASLLENMGLHGGCMVDFDGGHARLALSPNVEHFVVQLKRAYSEIDIAYLVFRFLCNPAGSITNSRTTLLPCIVFVNSKHTMQRIAHLLFLIMVKVYKELRYRITLVAQGHVFRRPNFESVPTISNESLEECPATIVLATDAFARGLDLPAVRSVVNFELPESLATLTHRVGRCARGLNSGVAISVQRSEVEYKFDTLVNFDLSRVVSIDEESLCDYRGTEGPRLSDFPVRDSDMLEVSRRFSESMDVYLTTLYDREFGH